MGEEPRNLGSVFLRSANPMLIVDDERRYVDANPAACRLIGLSVEELRELRVDDLTPADARGEIESQWRTFMADGVHAGDYVLERPDGSRVSFDYSATANIEPGRHFSILLPHSQDGDAATASARRGAQLSEREREVLEHMALGATMEETGERLGVSPETIRTHAGNARAKLGARSRAHAIALALRDGLIPPP